MLDLALPYDGKASKLQTGVAAALVMAAAGFPVLLHGADDVPAKRGVGPLNLLRALDYPVDASPEVVSAAVEASNFGVLNMAQIFPEWTALTPIRHHFGLRTLMNTTEKLLNPAQAETHISGFYHGSYLNRLAPALPGSERSWIVQGEEGSVDIRPGKKSRVYRADGDEMVEITINAADFGFADETPLEMPNDAAAHALVIKDALSGTPGPADNQIALTAGALLWMAGHRENVADGVETAQQILRSGQVLELLKTTRQTT